MKRLIFLFVILFVGATQCMYHGLGSVKLKYDEVTLTNKSLIPLEVSWTEITIPQGKPQKITKEILPGTTITVKLGEIGGYSQGEAKITWKPTSLNESLKQEFPIDLPNSKAFAFTAVTLADIMKNIWIPGMFTADDKGNFTTFQYMNIQYIDKILGQLYEVRPIK